MQNKLNKVFNSLARYPFIFLLLLSSIIQLNAQQWVIYDASNSALTNNFINSLHHHNDTLWVGTEDGLYSLQQNQWTAYLNQPFYDVRSITSTPDGTIWIGSFLNGLARFDGNVWTYFTTLNSGLQDDHIRALAYDTISSTLWIGTSGGLHAYQNNTWSYYSTANSTIPGNNIPCLATEQGILWGGTINNGMFQLSNGIFSAFTLVNSGIGDNTQLSIEIDSQGNKWISTPANGLSILSSSGAWSVFNIFNSGISSNSVNSAGFACNSSYIGTANAGLATFGTWITYNTSNSALPNDEVRAITNQEDTLYIGTYGGGLAVFKPCFNTSIKEVEPQIEWNVYPNPTRNLLNLYFNKVNNNPYNAILYDSKGVLRLTLEVISQKQSIDLSLLESGQYFLRLEIEGKRFTKKILKLD